MVVFGTLKTENAGNIIYSGSLEECNEYVNQLNWEDYYALDICFDNGVIKEYLVSPFMKGE